MSSVIACFRKVTMTLLYISKTTMSSVIACFQKVTMTLIYISKTTISSVIVCFQKATMPSFTFRRQQCLKSLHAFKRRQCPPFHFEDDNVFSHCMPSKGNNALIYILKMTMSSFTLSKMTMSSSQRLQCLLSLCFIGLDVLCFYAFLQKREENKKIENENEKKKKKTKKEELQYLHPLVAGWMVRSLKRN